MAFGGAVSTYAGASGELGSIPASLLIIGFSVTFWQAVLVLMVLLLLCCFAPSRGSS